MLGCVVELEERVAPDPDLRLQVCSMGGRGLKPRRPRAPGGRGQQGDRDLDLALLVKPD
jgi:hypothetical protein